MELIIQSFDIYPNETTKQLTLDNILGLYRIEWLESKLICADK
jgi:hypothetical protein